MRTQSVCIAVVIATMATIACVSGSTTTNNPNDGTGRSAATTREAADATTDPRKALTAQRGAAAAGADVCAILQASDITEITGVPIERTQKTPNGCEWYANAASQQQKGADTARATFETLSKQEPKSAAEGVRTMENLMKGLGGAIAPTKPLFAATVHWTDGDQAETMFKGTVAVTGGGQPGGALEPIEGLGDRAFIGAMGMLFYVRKGPALVLFGAMGITREQEIALAKKFVSKL